MLYQIVLSGLRNINTHPVVPLHILLPIRISSRYFVFRLLSHWYELASFGLALQ